MSTYINTLTIAGSDCSGGAGIQADLKTFSALGCYGMSVITALTAQNTQGVQAVFPISPEFIGEQIDSIFQDIHVNAVKIGMLHNSDVIQMVAEKLQHYQAKKIIVDPVMVSKNGSVLLEHSAINTLKTTLFPIAVLITPNIYEAELLAEMKITDRTSMEKTAIALSKYGSQAILIKGGHLSDETSPDCLYLVSDKKIIWLSGHRIQTHNTHGTGCTLSAAITALLAKNPGALHPAIVSAKQYVSDAITAGADYQLGHGQGPVHHFHDCWN